MMFEPPLFQPVNAVMSQVEVLDIQPYFEENLVITVPANGLDRVVLGMQAGVVELVVEIGVDV